MQVEIALKRVQVDPAVLGDINCVVLAHELDRSLYHPANAASADEHVMGFFFEYELARAGQRIEAAFGKGGQLELPVPVGEIGEEEKREPVWRGFVERAQDPRVVGRPGS